jgi:NADH-quinone oxidoreductase subunit K
MSGIPVAAGWLLATALLTIGIVGALTRRNLLFLLLSIELMFNAAALAFIVAGARWGQPDGQVMFVFILAVSAAEVAVGLALMLRYYRCFGTLDTRAAGRLKD